MRICGDATLADLDLTEHQVVMIAHNDTAHRHLHLMVNRVHPGTGKAWHTGNDYARLEKSVAKQARTFDLLVVPGRHNSPEAFRDRPIHVKNGEFQMHGRTGGPKPKDRWSIEEIKSRRHQLQPIFAGARSWDQLSSLLAKEGLGVSKKGQGIIIADAFGYMKLSDLGKDVRLKALEGLYRESFAAFDQRRALHDELEAQRAIELEAQQPDMPTKPATATGAAEDDDIMDDAVHETLVDKETLPTAKTTRLRHSTGGDRASLSYEVKDTSSPPRDLDDDEKQLLREEARRRREEEREQQRAQRRAQNAAAASASGDEAAESQPDFHVNSAAAPEPQMAEAPDDNQLARSEAFAKLSAAREALDFTYSLGSLADEDQLARAREDVARAEEDLARHQTMVEWVNKGVAEKLAELANKPKPKTPPAAAVEPDLDDDYEDEEEMGR
jgi:hypothetical protein